MENLHIPIPDQIKAVRRAFAETFCKAELGLSEPTASEIRVFTRAAPPWPESDEFAVRVPRIRFGEADEGVAKTWEAHLARIVAVFGDQIHLLPSNITLLRARKRLRLFGGNQTHRPGLTWGTLYLNANRRQRQSISKVRRSVAQTPRSVSAADELLVFAWLFPDYIRGIDYRTTFGLCAGGYEYNQHQDRVPWDRTPSIWRKATGIVELSFVGNDFSESNCAVPVFVPFGA